ncbi:hypothetical protein T440DRAFT_190795 [Plenodomus tracheiphilus IPT5]|uniref:Uncharacterized protein n=1 Tax=Plenodomus tracheiphilus IPT5 TaxID=1408161 RepID=A0A6A7AZR0_9PLEO|nr:hypothetical protein T440DRAFT_190795 [Plenodomus tracheiphilus IPT5]
MSALLSSTQDAPSYSERDYVMEVLLPTPEEQLCHVGLHSWASWFHIVVVSCKLVLPQDNERCRGAKFADLPQEIISLFPKQGKSGTAAIERSASTAFDWRPATVARRYSTVCKNCSSALQTRYALHCHSYVTSLFSLLFKHTQRLIIKAYRDARHGLHLRNLETPYTPLLQYIIWCLWLTL